MHVNFFSDRNVEYSKCNRIYFDIDKFSKYKLFCNLVIKDKFIIKPNGCSCYATQGVCSIGDNILITSYDTKYDINNIRGSSKNSILDIVDSLGRYKTLYFDNRCHVGGVSYCENNNKLYVSADNCVNIYDVYYISQLASSSIIEEYSSYSLDIKVDKINTASYLTVYDNYIYVGKFKRWGISFLSKYKLSKNGNMHIENVYKVPYSKIQGMCICNYNNEDYYLFSCSYGRRFNSKIYITKLINDKFVEISNITLPSMAEQISFDKDGDLMIVFESDCYKYFDVNGKLFNNISGVCFLDIKSIFNSVV